MRRLLLAFAAAFVLLLVPVAAHAGPISLSVTVDLGPSRVITTGPDPNHTELVLSVPVNPFTAPSLDGSVLDLDVLFTDGQFLRMFTSSGGSPMVGVKFYTDAIGISPYPSDDSTGALIRQDGSRFGGEDVGIVGTLGWFSVDLFPEYSYPSLQRPYDFYGLYLHILLPNNPSVRVTGADFQVWMYPPTRLGVGPDIPPDLVPDPGSTLLLFGMGLVGLGAWRKRRSQRTSTSIPKVGDQHRGDRGGLNG